MVELTLCLLTLFWLLMKFMVFENNITFYNRLTIQDRWCSKE